MTVNGQKSSNYVKFKNFFAENKHLIHMPGTAHYPINYEKGKAWANSQCDQESRDFADNILEHTRYVSYAEFIKQLKIVCISYHKSYTPQNRNNTEFILVIPFKVNKSNMWVSLLAFEYLQDIITDVGYSITNIYNDMINPSSAAYGKNVRCIICDDCAYTGHQISSIASFDHAYILYAKKKPAPPSTSKKWLLWYNSVHIEAEKHINKIPITKFSVDLVIPYMSILAQAKLKTFHYIKIPADCIVFPIFSQQINTERIPTHIMNEFRRTFQYHKDISAIYFDHKVADAVSTFHKIYLLAPLFNCSIKNRKFGFIENCDKKTIPDTINIYDYHVNIEKEEIVCPPTFYKQLKYTYNKKTIDTERPIYEIFANTK